MRVETTPASIQLAVQSRRRMVRDTFAAYFASRPDFTVVGRVSDCDDLIPLCELRQPEAIVFDPGPRLVEAIETYRDLRFRFPHLRGVVLYDEASPEQVTTSARAGGIALLPYSRGLDALIALLGQLSGLPETTPDRYPVLADHELTILALMGSGHSVHEMAALLGRSPRVVEHYKRRIHTKLEARSGVHAVSRATALGIVRGEVPGTSPIVDPSAEIASSTAPVDHDTDPMRPVLAVVRGLEGSILDRVVPILTASRLPFVLDEAPGQSDCPAERPDHADIVRSHPGPVVVVLVDPTPSDWQVPSILDAATSWCAASRRAEERPPWPWAKGRMPCCPSIGSATTSRRC